jgi:hypothetical protein
LSSEPLVVSVVRPAMSWADRIAILFFTGVWISTGLNLERELASQTRMYTSSLTGSEWVFLIAWCLICIALLLRLGWTFFGKTVIEIRPRRLTVDKRIGFWTIRRLGPIGAERIGSFSVQEREYKLKGARVVLFSLVMQTEGRKKKLADFRDKDTALRLVDGPLKRLTGAV